MDKIHVLCLVTFFLLRVNVSAHSLFGQAHSTGRLLIEEYVVIYSVVVRKDAADSCRGYVVQSNARHCKVMPNIVPDHIACPEVPQLRGLVGGGGQQIDGVCGEDAVPHPPLVLVQSAVESPVLSIPQFDCLISGGGGDGLHVWGDDTL